MEIVDNGDNVTITPVRSTRTAGCIHVAGAWARWDGTENPPQLVYNGFPADGVMILSKNTVFVCCKSCWTMGWGLQILKSL